MKNISLILGTLYVIATVIYFSVYFKPKEVRTTNSMAAEASRKYVERSKNPELIDDWDISSKAEPASVSYGGYKTYTLSNSITEESSSLALEKVGFTKQYAEKYAATTTPAIKSPVVKQIGIFTAATGFTYLLGNIFLHGMNFWEQLSVSVAFGLIITLIYNLAKRKGIMK